MVELITALASLKDTPAPSILIVGGILFLILAIVGEFAGKIRIRPLSRNARIGAGIVGALLLISGILLPLGPNIIAALNPLPTIDDQTSPAGSAAEPALSAPATVFPGCNNPTKYPKEGPLLFIWARVEGASHYTLEVDCFGCEGVGNYWYSYSMESPWRLVSGVGLDEPVYRSKFHQDSEGAPLRWRVWAVDEESFEGIKSNWCKFTFKDKDL